MADNNKLLEVDNLKTYFDTETGLVKAVDGISFDIDKGKTLGVVGESGCGKSVTALSIMQLLPHPKGKIVDGNIYYHTKQDEVIDLAQLHPKRKKIRSIRGNEIAMIFQEPMVSLNPVYTIGQQIMEGIRMHRNVTKEQAKEQAIEMLKRVEMSAPGKRVEEYPHELSGGMRQRAMIAIALSCDPNLLIADEPTTALDVTIESQILELMQGLQDRLGMSIMMITHDLGVIGQIADDVIVMYLGKVAEDGTLDEILEEAKHPYTQGLMESIPEVGRKSRLKPISGTVPDMRRLPKGCYFAPRCPEVMDICRQKEPPRFDVEKGHIAKCWLYEE